MSSELDGLGIIAAAVAVPAATAFGAGWLAWQGGKLLVEANREINRQIAEKKHQLEEAARQRKMAAVAAHTQLVDMCSQILSQLEAEHTSGLDPEVEQLKSELKQISNEPLSEDISRVESMTSLGYLKLDGIVSRQERLASIRLSDSEAGLYHGLSVADFMNDLRIAIGAMEIHATVGQDVKAADPMVLERIKLNEKLASVTNRIVTALESVEQLSRKYGLTDAARTWYQSCFNGVDGLIETLCRPTTTNKELKKGIGRLEDAFDRYETMAPSIEREAGKMSALYSVYTDAANALGEKVERFSAFRTSAEIETKLKYLQKRAEKAQECAAIYQQLGPAAYMCYAWDQELQAMGYEVHSRKEITEMAGNKPEHATLGDSKLPFYRWSEEDLTQLYSITSDCSLQVVVSDDGTVTMQTIAEEDNEKAKSTQHSHCSHMKELHERLKKNWFIQYDFDEKESPDSVTTVAKWKYSEDNVWNENRQQMITDERTSDKTAVKTKQMK